MTAALAVRGLGIAAGGSPLVSGVSFDVARGRSLAIVGESGSGKSLSVRATLGLLPPGLTWTGSIEIDGAPLRRESDFRRRRGRTVSLVMQDPFTTLNPLRRIGRQIADGLPARYGPPTPEVARRLREVGLDAELADRYPHELSGGMRQRVGLAAALAADPEILIADEPTTALDATTQREVLSLIRSLQREREMAFVLITHDLRVAFSMCDEVVVLYAGSVLERGPSEEVRRRPRHPYTASLLASEPPVEHRVERLSATPGRVPAHEDVLDRCAFLDRCSWASPACTAGRPELAPAGTGHLTACVRVGEITGQLNTSLNARVVEDGAVRRASPVLASVRGLTKSFTRAAPPALDGVDVEVRAGESVGIVGESGSGKTTLGRCLVGLETPSSGTITFSGLARETVQMVFQDPSTTLNPAHTVGAALAEALWAAGRPHRRADVRDLLDLVGLAHGHARRRPVALSGGERQRVAIARALARRPQLLICDESVSALDLTVQAEILDLLVALRAELSMSLLFITHDLAVLRQVSEYVYVLRRGVCVEHGPTARVLDAPRDAYTRQLLASVPPADSTDWLGTGR